MVISEGQAFSIYPSLVPISCAFILIAIVSVVNFLPSRNIASQKGWLRQNTAETFREKIIERENVPSLSFGNKALCFVEEEVR